MRKSEAQHNHAQNQPVAKQGRGAVLNSPQGEQIAQFEAMAESSPQVNKLAQLAAMANNSPYMAAQRKSFTGIHNSLNVTAQREEAPAKSNSTGLPDNLKNGVESLSGMSMDSVKVHYNSSQPAKLNAHAYAQGTDIHVAPGQEQHLPHEAWHVVQQAQGRVQPTMQMKEGVSVNDDAGLEHEADVMGGRATTAGVVQEKTVETALIEWDMSASPARSPTPFMAEQVSQRSKTEEEAKKEMEGALGKDGNEEESDEEEAEEDYYIDGDPEQYYIEGQHMEGMLSALDQYMSIELDGLEATIEQDTIISGGWLKFLEIIQPILGNKNYGNYCGYMLNKFLRSTKDQPELSKGKTIPEIIIELNKKKGQICNQSVGGAVLEILTRFKKC